MNLHYTKANVGGSVGTAVVCVSHKVAECFLMYRNYDYWSAVCGLWQF